MTDTSVASGATLPPKVAQFVSQFEGLRAAVGVELASQADHTGQVACPYYVLAGGLIAPGRMIVAPHANHVRRCWWCSYNTKSRMVRTTHWRFERGPRLMVDDLVVVCPDCEFLWQTFGADASSVAEEQKIMRRQVAQFIRLQDDPEWADEHPRANTHSSYRETVMGPFLEDPAQFWRKLDGYQRNQVQLREMLLRRYGPALLSSMESARRKLWLMPESPPYCRPPALRRPSDVPLVAFDEDSVQETQESDDSVAAGVPAQPVGGPAGTEEDDDPITRLLEENTALLAGLGLEVPQEA